MTEKGICFKNEVMFLYVLVIQLAPKLLGSTKKTSLKCFFNLFSNRFMVR